MKKKSRLDKIWEEYSVSISSVCDDIGHFKDMLLKTDPSERKKNLRWILELLSENKLSPEQVLDGEHSELFKVLSDFEKYSSQLDIENRSLNKYKDLMSLKSVLQPFQETTSLFGKYKREVERNKAQAETIILTPSDININSIDKWPGSMKVISPVSQYASCWWGRGTRWCTSASKDNMFHYYNSKAPLYIIMMPDKKKLKLWKYKKEIQFVDEQNKNVSKYYIDENWKYLSEIIIKMNNLKYFPEIYLTEEICNNIVSEYPEDKEFLYPDTYEMEPLG